MHRAVIVRIRHQMRRQALHFRSSPTLAREGAAARVRLLAFRSLPRNSEKMGAFRAGPRDADAETVIQQKCIRITVPDHFRQGYDTRPRMLGEPREV